MLDCDHAQQGHIACVYIGWTRLHLGWAAVARRGVFVLLCSVFHHLFCPHSLVTHNTNRDITERHRRLAEIIEMIHTASLVHDDVLDDCSVRRG